MDNLILQVGDLVMCRIKSDPHGELELHNAKLVIGWITKKALNGYYVQWCDKEIDGFVNTESTILTRKLFLEQRKAMGL
jgi:hypothetical protein